ncbi:MAG: aminotransferase class I/II-fold pyridoxal phosphate-dependent enzyme [Calditrichia bacterium]|nr:aminotransferase class I/II-fold pyridoxal phosphate-dependent enzyme [Calditrichia bacterium]
MQIEDFKLERYFAKYEFTAPYSLCSSDCESFKLSDILKLEPGSREKLDNLWLSYTESMGDPELRINIAKTYKGISAENILVHTGAEEAIFNFMNTVLQKGDHVIVHYPGYQSLHEVARAIGCEVTLWQAEEKNNWQLDLDFLKKNIKSNTKVVVVNVPHNPTGYLMPENEFQELTSLSQKHGFILFSDEVYRYLEYDENERLPALCEIDESGVSLGVMSKSYGLPGLRIGWIATKNKTLYNKMASFKDYTTICNSAPGEFLANIAIKHGEKLYKRNLDIILGNIKILNSFFKKHENIFNWNPPKAGPIAFPSLKNEKNSDEFCHNLVTGPGVLFLPGSLYGNYSSNFRIGFGRVNMKENLKRVEKFL